MSETETELKPCPFCGCELPGLTFRPIWNDYQIWCADCAAQTDQLATESSAVAAWNTRASDNRRCENCEHFDAEVRNDCQWCRALNHAAHPDFFCADFTKRGE